MGMNAIEIHQTANPEEEIKYQGIILDRQA